MKTQHKKHHEGQASALPGGGILDIFGRAARARIAVAARTISSAKVVGWFACVEVVVEDVLLHEIYNVRLVFELKAARSTSTRSSSIGAVPALTSRAAPSKKVVSNKVRLSIFFQSSFSVLHAPFQARALCSYGVVLAARRTNTSSRSTQQPQIRTDFLYVFSVCT